MAEHDEPLIHECEKRPGRPGSLIKALAQLI
jgi:hypothetical protein